MALRHLACLIGSFQRLHVSAVHCLLLLLACLSSYAHAIVTSDIAGSHVVEPGAMAFGIDTTGVARIDIGIGGATLYSATAALITDRHLLTAAHNVDEDRDGVAGPFILQELLSFSAIFELAGGPVSVPFSLTGATIIPGWGDSLADLAVVELDEAAPAGIPRYPLYGANDEVGKPAVLVGYGIMGHGSTGAIESAHVKRAGLNRFEALGEDIDFSQIGVEGRIPPGVSLVTDFDGGLPTNNALQLDQGIASDLGFGPDEAFLALGDSGGPVLIDGAIAGVMAWASGFATGDATADPYDSSWGELSFETRVSSFQDFITSATDGQAVFVPEPGAWLLLVCSMLCCAVCRRPLPCFEATRN
jgi:hypothetical protein